MAELDDLLIRIDATTESLRRELRRAEKATDSSTRKMDRHLKKVDEAFVRIGKRAAAATAAMAALAAAGATAKIVSVGRQTDILSAQLETATGSADAAAEAFRRLEKFAAETPFTLEEVVNSFVKLTNLGLDPSERALTSYGNTASAMGKSLNDFMEAVADAATAEFERLKEFGIRAKNQGDTIAFTFRGVTTEVTNSAAAIEEHLIRLGELNFAGGMQRRAESLDGALSNLGESWDSLFRTIYQGPIGQSIEDQVRKGIEALDRLSARVANIQGTATPEQRLELQISDLEQERARIEAHLKTAPFGGDWFNVLNEQLDRVTAKLKGSRDALAYFRGEFEGLPQAAPAISPSVSTRPDPSAGNFGKLSQQHTDALLAAEAEEREHNQKLIDLAQERFNRIHKMALEAQGKTRELEALRYAEQQTQLQTEMDRLRQRGLMTQEIEAGYRKAREDAELIHRQNLTDIAETEAEKQRSLEQSLLQTWLNVAEQIAASLAGIAKEGSAAQKAAFLVQKGIAFARVGIDTQVAAMNAMANIPYPTSLAAKASIMLQGQISQALIASQAIAGVAHSGMDEIPREGTYLLDKGERVVSPKQNKDLTRFLQNGGGAPQMRVVIQEAPGGNVENRPRMQEDGTLLIEQVVRRVVNGDIASGRGIAGTMQQTFGLTRKGRT